MSLSLPNAPSATTSSIQKVPAPAPAAPATAPASSSAPYERVWVTSVESTSPIALAIAPTVVVLAGEDTPLEARSLENGNVVWTSPATINTSPVVRDGRVFGVGEGRLQALSLDRGEPLWSVALEGVSPGPTVANDVVVVATDVELRAYRTTNGGALWRQPLGTPPLDRPVEADGLFVVAFTSHEVGAFDGPTGAPRWRSHLDSAPGPMAADRERVFFGTTSGPCALYRRNGELDWCFRTVPVPAAGHPAVQGGLVYFALRDNTLRAFDTGGTLKRLESLPTRPIGGPLRAGSHLAVPMATGTFALLALEGPPSAPRVAFEQTPGQLEAGVASVDGTWLVTLTVELNARRSLAGYRRKADAPAKK